MKSGRLLNHVCSLPRWHALASAQLPAGNAPLYQRGVVCWFRTVRIVFVLTGALVACFCLSPSLHAGIIYNLEPLKTSVYPGGALSVPIVVSSDQPLNWLNTGFTITWNSSVLNLQATPFTLGSMFAGATAPVYSASAGQLVFSWYDQSSGLTGIAVPNGSTLLTLNFQAVGDWGNYGNSTILSGTNLASIVFTDFSSTTNVSFPPGSVTIIPEPIDWAFGLFACLFIGGATVRWVSHRRMSLQLAQAVSQGNLRT